jgi:hypothetical protein
MQWLWSNKEWLFSGIGVALVGLLFQVFVRGRVSRNSAVVSADRNSSVLGSPVASGSNITQVVNLGVLPGGPAQSQQELGYPSTPTPVDIHNHLRGLPVYQRSLTKDSYVGLKVRWQVTFRNVQALPPTLPFKTDDTHDLIAFYEPGAVGIIRARITIGSFPRLKIAHEGARMEIAGEIEYVSENGDTRLKDVHIAFLD